jgi:A/G-specific adenine glycosylase
MDVSRLLGEWYDKNKRILPWRKTHDPYKIWISEIILQQTRVNQGIEYYNRFILLFPTVFDLAKTPIHEVLKVWQGLGYYTRARNMHKAANSIVTDYKGEFPQDIYSLKTLKGIGDYSAAAISSIAFNQAHPVLDGNVYRVLSRLQGIELATDSSQGKKYFYEIAFQLLDKNNPGRHNQAIMELGALVCLPSNPQCNVCPLVNLCFAFQHNAIGRYPVKKRKVIRRDRYFQYIVIRKGSHIFLKQRREGDIWALLYEFPMIETDMKIDYEELTATEAWKKIAGNGEFRLKNISREYKHQLTHQIIHAQFIEVEVNIEYTLEQSKELKYEKLFNYPISRLTEKYLKDKKNNP